VNIFIDSNLLVYLLVGLSDESEEKALDDFWLSLLRDHSLYVNTLVWEELGCMASRYIRLLSLSDLRRFRERMMPFVEEIYMTSELYSAGRYYERTYGLKYSDAIHAATVKLHELDAIASDDTDFDRTGIRRIWFQDSEY